MADELELKWRPADFASFQAILDKQKKKKKESAGEERTLHMINQTQNVRRTSLYDEKGKKLPQAPIWIRKTVLATRRSGPFVLKHAREEPIPEMSLPKQGLLVRLRRRCSFSLSEEFRLDMSITLTLNDTLPSSDLLRDFFSGKMEEEEIKKKSSYEAEIEYVGKEPISIATFQDRVLPLAKKLFLPSSTSLSSLAAELLFPSSRSPPSTFRDIVSQAKMLNKFEYFQNIYPANGYILLEKTDGERCLASCIDEDEMLQLWFSTGSPLEFKKKKKKKNTSPPFILDAEWSASTKTLHIFDVLWVDGEVVHTYPYLQRLEFFEVLQKSYSSSSFEGLTLRFKPYILLHENIQQAVETLYTTSSPKLDGLILAESDKNYYQTTHYKWKPFEQNTIDFYLVRRAEKEKTTSSYHLYSTAPRHFSTLAPTLPHPTNPRVVYVRFQPSINPTDYVFEGEGEEDLHGQIVELGKDRTTMKWIFHRHRKDKDHANHIRVAETTYYNFYSPFDIEMLWTAPSSPSYFQTSEHLDVFKPMLHYNSRVKQELFHRLKRPSCLIDIAAGRASDIHKYRISGIPTALLVEVDEAAIYEIIKRKYDVLLSSHRHSSNKNTELLILRQDVTRPYLETYEKIRNFTSFCSLPVSAVTCFFAAHYLVYTPELQDNFAQLLELLLKKGGVFCATLFDGDRVRSFLQSLPSSEWCIENSYKIRLVSDHTIELKLPFTGSALYTEHLISFQSWIRVMERHGLELVEQKKFTEFFPEGTSASLRPEDVQFIDLYSSLMFRKK